jgi:hypothetical protein
VCYLEESIFYISLTAYLMTGPPFLEGISEGLVRCAEGGLVDRYWSGLQMLALLQSKGSALDENSNTFFAFNMSHLSAAFGILTLGHAFSFVIFLCEIFSKILLHVRNRKTAR